MVSTPTGPPPNFSTMVERMRRSIGSSPAWSMASRWSARAATSRVTVPSPSTSAKSRTRRSRRLAMRGVPRERRAISAPPSASSFTPRMREERSRICSRKRGS